MMFVRAGRGGFEGLTVVVAIETGERESHSRALDAHDVNLGESLLQGERLASTVERR